jgi:hypothetical protein
MRSSRMTRGTQATMEEDYRRAIPSRGHATQRQGGLSRISSDDMVPLMAKSP